MSASGAASRLGPALAAAVVACLLLAAAASAAYPGRNGKLVFQTFRNGAPDCYTMRADGSHERPLFATPGYDGCAAFSPDGRRIVAESDGEGPYELYTMNADGSGLRRVTFNDAFDSDASWSPDGQWLVYQSRVLGGVSNIFVMRADGSELHPITSAPANQFPNGVVEQGDNDPVWSPDGKSIAFVRQDYPSYEIYTMNPDGSGLRRLTTNFHWDAVPAWSPDSSRLLFLSARNDPPGNVEIYEMRRDGSHQRRLTRTTQQEFDPDFSPDGRFITFSSGQFGVGALYGFNDLFRMPAAGGPWKRLTSAPLDDESIRWQPLPVRCGERASKAPLAAPRRRC